MLAACYFDDGYYYWPDAGTLEAGYLEFFYV